MNLTREMIAMTLLPDWKRVARKAWSVRLGLLAALLGAAEVGIQLFAVSRPTPYLAMAAAVLSLAASIARLVAQPRMHDER
jgi:membrane protein YdbS with pleckstrin-like domain